MSPDERYAVWLFRAGVAVGELVRELEHAARVASSEGRQERAGAFAEALTMARNLAWKFLEPEPTVIPPALLGDKSD